MSKDSSKSNRPPLVLAVSSGGGHWVQLLRLRPAFQDCRVVFATVNKNYQSDLEQGAELHTIADANISKKTALIHSAFSVLLLLLKLRPDIVITTGAAPGYFALILAKLLGIRTILARQRRQCRSSLSLRRTCRQMG